jgi:hypothetical protein
MTSVCQALTQVHDGRGNAKSIRRQARRREEQVRILKFVYTKSAGQMRRVFAPCWTASVTDSLAAAWR